MDRERWMLLAKEFLFHPQGVTLHFLRLCQSLLCMKDAGQAVERAGHLDIFVSEEFSSHRQCFAMERCGLGQRALTVIHLTECIERKGNVLVHVTINAL